MRHFGRRTVIQTATYLAGHRAALRAAGQADDRAGLDDEGLPVRQGVGELRLVVRILFVRLLCAGLRRI